MSNINGGTECRSREKLTSANINVISGSSDVQNCFHLFIYTIKCNSNEVNPFPFGKPQDLNEVCSICFQLTVCGRIRSRCVGDIHLTPYKYQSN